MNTKEISSVCEFIVEIGGPLEDGGFGVRDLRDRAKCNKERHLVFEVGGVLREATEHLGRSL